MVSSEELLEPQKVFKRLADEHDQLTADYFDELVKKSGIDTAENTYTIEKYKKKMGVLNNQKKRLSKFQLLKGILIFLIIAALAGMVSCIVLVAKQMMKSGLGVGVAVGCGILAIGLIILTVKVPSKVIKDIKNGLSVLTKEIEGLKEEGYNQCHKLNMLFDYDMHVEIISKMFKSIEFYKRFEPQQYQTFNEFFGLEEYEDNDKSTVHVQAGSILGNPFIVETARIMAMGTATYSGTLTITYPERVPNGKGGYTTRMRTQILHASVIKPKPYYDYEKVLYFGSDVAPKLKFSRKPSGMSEKSQKEQNSYIKSEWKRIESRAQKDIAKGFTPIANEPFEALFHALDRNNEVEFRLLFTPLAQKNFVNLIKTKEPFGDDFIFKKDKKINIIRTEHSQYIDYVGDPQDFVDFDYQNARQKFIDFNHKYFESIYFDLVPILSIPLYHQLPKIGESNKKYAGNVTKFEKESLANMMDEKIFMPDSCVTPLILKNKFVSKEGKSDFNMVTAHGFTTIEHIAFVPTLGGDGLTHPVPVHWLEYIPVEKEVPFTVINKEQSRLTAHEKERTESFQSFFKKYGNDNHIIFRKGFFGVINPSNSAIKKTDIDLISKN